MTVFLYFFLQIPSSLIMSSHDDITSIHHSVWTFMVQSDTKKQELLKNPTKIEEIQEKKFINRN